MLLSKPLRDEKASAVGAATPLTHFQFFAHHPEPVAAPEQLAVDHERGHAENAGLFGFAANPLQFAPPLAVRELVKGGARGAGLRERLANRFTILDIQLALPEALEHDIVVSAQRTMPLCVYHSNQIAAVEESKIFCGPRTGKPRRLASRLASM
jgi:hypothetical protein